MFTGKRGDKDGEYEHGRETQAPEPGDASGVDLPFVDMIVPCVLAGKAQHKGDTGGGKEKGGRNVKQFQRHVQ